MHFLFSMAIGLQSLLLNNALGKQLMRIPAEKIDRAVEVQTSLMYGTLLANILAASLFSFYIIHKYVKHAATPGKLLCRIQLQKPDKTPITYKDAFIRFLPYMIFLFMLALVSYIADINAIRDLKELPPLISIDLSLLFNLFAGIWVIGSALWIFFDSHGRAPHDLPVHTLIVKA